MPVSLLEDVDGIPASGLITCDRTPTLTWDAAAGIGPFLYAWEARLLPAGTLVVSGSVVSGAIATLPQLDLGSYQFILRAADASGTITALPSGSFSLVDCSLFRTSSLSLPGLLDIEPAEIQPPDYVRYLPRWMSLYGKDGVPPSGALFFQFWQQPLTELRRFAEFSQQALDQASIQSVPVGLPRQAWVLQTRFTARDAVNATAQVSGSLKTVRRAFSLFDFLTDSHPVFVLDDHGRCLCRNLAERILTVAAQASTGEIAHQYRFDTDRIEPDADVYFTYQGTEYRLKAGSRAIDPVRGIVQLTSAFSGSIQFRYQSQVYLTSLTLSVSGAPFLSPNPVDLSNRIDEIGLLAGIKRFPGEDNKNLRERVRSRLAGGRGATLSLSARHVAQELDRTMLLGWDGRATLDLAASGIYGIRQVDVVWLSQWQAATETLVRETLRRYSASKSDWLPGWLITVDGIPATQALYPSIAVSGNYVDFGREVSGAVIASFRYEQYTLERSSAGFITRVIPVLRNSPSGNYQVVLTRNVRAFTAAARAYIESDLLNPDGSPNGFFQALREKLLENSPIHFARARWNTAHWLLESDDLPLTEHLPVPLDTGIS